LGIVDFNSEIVGRVSPDGPVISLNNSIPVPTEYSTIRPDYSDVPVDPFIDQLVFGDHLSSEQIVILKRLLSKHRRAFAFSNEEFGVTNLIEHDIELADEIPIRCRPYRVSAEERKEIQSQLKTLLDQDIIESSDSPWSSPTILIRKGDKKSFRLVIDYRALNAKSKKQSHPLSRIDDIFDALSGFKFITLLDLVSAFHQVPLSKRARMYSGFTTVCGNFCYKRMPFGLSGAPHTFQRLMDKLLGNLKWEIAVCFLDDLGVHGKSFEEHNYRLNLVLQKIEDAGLTLKPSKCQFAMTRVKFLGHIISPGGIEVDPEKIEAIVKYPRPTNLTKLRGFVALCSFYRRYVPLFSTIASPLNDLTKKDVKYTWSDSCEDAFNSLKGSLVKAPVLAHYDPELPVKLATDASQVGFGATLSHIIDGEEHPIAYFSRSTSKSQKNYSPTDLEGLAIVEAVKHFRPYLYDALSRNPVNNAVEDEFPETYLFTLKLEDPPPDSDLMVKQRNDLFCGPILIHKNKFIRSNLTPLSDKFPEFSVINGLLYRAVVVPNERLWKLCIPQECVESLLRTVHDNPVGGHF
ncbi:unnamed protein product, partial [Allacma fusca]